MWSPKSSKGGADIYRFMRETKRGDVILHLTDDTAFTGMSSVASSCVDFNGVPGTEWGEGPSYLVRLSEFSKLEPQLHRDVFFASPFREQMIALLKAGTKNLFYNQEPSLNQGAYITPAPADLVTILDGAYEHLAGRKLTDIVPPLTRTWIFQSNPELFDINGALSELKEMTWLVRQHPNDIRRGDKVFLWEAGEDAGVLGIATVLTDPADLAQDDEQKKFNRRSEKFDAVQPRVRLSIDHVLADRIKRQILLDHPILGELRILKAAQGTNFSLTDEQTEALDDLVRTLMHKKEVYTLDQFMSDTGFDSEIIEGWIRKLKRKKYIIFQGPPGTGKTYIAELLARYIVSGTGGFTDVVQFHPTYAYEDFIQSLTPRPIGKGGAFELVPEPGRLLEFCAKACKAKEKAKGSDEAPCVLIIDEINRAHVSRVFGELMYLLEYPDRDIPLASGGEPFKLPGNLFIIGTMNTADRSIALVDHALRRRFCFVRLNPEYKVLEKYLESKVYPAKSLIKVLQEINKAIDDPNYEIGISFFMKKSDAGKLREVLPDIWTSEIEPYLEEFFYDQRKKVDDFRWSALAQAKLKDWTI